MRGRRTTQVAIDAPTSRCPLWHNGRSARTVGTRALRESYSHRRICTESIASGSAPLSPVRTRPARVECRPRARARPASIGSATAGGQRRARGDLPTPLTVMRSNNATRREIDLMLITMRRGRWRSTQKVGATLKP